MPSTPDVKQILLDPPVVNYVAGTLVDMLQDRGYPKQAANRLSQDILRFATSYGLIENYERRTHDYLEDAGFFATRSHPIFHRERTILGYVEPYLSGRILDVGCGSGIIDFILAKQGHDVSMTDVFKHPSIKRPHPEFRPITIEGKIDHPDNTFDTAMALTVLHHSDDPMLTVQEMQRVMTAGGTGLFLESEYGISTENAVMPRRDLQLARFLALSPDQQRGGNAFFDHFYNRVLDYTEHTSEKINVPCNFFTPADLNHLLERNRLVPVHTIHLDFDRDTAPMYHVLHVARKA